MPESASCLCWIHKKTGEKVIVAGKKVTIVDTVTLDGLEEGRKYQLKGWQMLKEENAVLLIDGKRVESDYTFPATIIFSPVSLSVAVV